MTNTSACQKQVVDTPEIFVHHASLSFGAQTIFRDLNFKAKAGAFTGILGPSGVGKTTLLKLIAGLHPCPQSTVTDAQRRPLTGRIAWMAQKDLLVPWLSVLDNVCLGHRLRGTLSSSIKTKASSLLADVGLSDVTGHYPDTLSGGMRQRAALARTLLENQPIVLMDEPFSAVDPITRLKLQDLSARLLAGRTVIFVTHDPLEAIRLGQTVYVLKGAPAVLQSIDLPASPCPRAVNDPSVLKAQADILAALSTLQPAEVP